MNNLRSIKADVQKIVALRDKLSLTPAEAGHGAGHNELVVNKIESASLVRPKVLMDLLQFYHQRLGIDDWKLDEFVANQTDQPKITEAELCSNCKLLRDYFKTVYCQRRPEEIDRFCSPEIRFTGEGASRCGIEVIRQRAVALLTAFNPIQFEFERLHSIDNVVYAAWHTKMKHVDEFAEIPATNRWVELRGTSIAKFEDSLAVESEDHFDVESIIRQIKGESPRVI